MLAVCLLTADGARPQTSLSNLLYVRDRLRSMEEETDDGSIAKIRRAGFKFLKELVGRHPRAEEKIPSDLKAFCLSDRDPRESSQARRSEKASWKLPRSGNSEAWKGREVHLQFEKADGSKEDVSWRKCVLQKEWSPTLMLHQAMRQAPLVLALTDDSKFTE